METPTKKSPHSSLHLDEETWIRMGRIYRRFPFLRNDKVLRTLFGLIAVTIAFALALIKEPCTCADQIVDEQLNTRAARGDSAVMAYLKSKDGAIICAAKRQALLKKPEENNNDSKVKHK